MFVAIRLIDGTYFEVGQPPHDLVIGHEVTEIRSAEGDYEIMLQDNSSYEVPITSVLYAQWKP